MTSPMMPPDRDERLHYQPFCRTWTTHGPKSHREHLRCDCPCHGGTAPWWHLARIVAR